MTTVTADKTYATIQTSDMIEPAMHSNAMVGDCPGKTEQVDVVRQFEQEKTPKSLIYLGVLELYGTLWDVFKSSSGGAGGN